MPAGARVVSNVTSDASPKVRLAVPATNLCATNLCVTNLCHEFVCHEFVLTSVKRATRLLARPGLGAGVRVVPGIVFGSGVVG